jgi:prepilin-type processing-associated H-X9-DG protein
MRDDQPVQPLEYEPRTDAGLRRAYWLKVMKLAIVVAIIFGGIAFVLPFLNQARVENPRLACANSLRQLGLGAIMYAYQNNLKIPDDLQTLFDSQELGSSVLVCPSSNLPSLSGATTQAADAAIAANQVSYIYLGKGLTLNAPADTVLMYEPLADHQDGINVLFVDAHVEWLDLKEAKKLLARIAVGENPVRYSASVSSTQP